MEVREYIKSVVLIGAMCKWVHHSNYNPCFRLSIWIQIEFLFM